MIKSTFSNIKVINDACAFASALMLHDTNRYHTVHHVNDMLSNLEFGIKVAKIFDNEKATPIKNFDHLVTLELAVILHDVFYQANYSSNEEKSAAIAEYFLASSSLTVPQRERVIKLILSTSYAFDFNTLSDIDHYLADYLHDLDYGYMRDIDAMRIATRQLRSEASLWDSKVFLENRLDFLNMVLSSGNVFHTNFWGNRSNEVARKNLVTHIDELSTYLSNITRRKRNVK